MGKKLMNLNRFILVITDIDEKWSVIFEYTINQLSFGDENAEFIDLKHQFEILQQEKAADRKLINSQQFEITRLAG